MLNSNIYICIPSRKQDKIIDNLGKFFDTIDQSLLVFGEGVRNYLYQNPEAFGLNLQAITKLENEAELMRREIEAELYRQSSLIRMRGDILRLLERMDHMIDTVNDDLFQFDIERPFIPSELNADYTKLLELSIQAAADTIPAAKAYFNDPGAVSDKVRRVHFYHKEAEETSKAIKRRVFHEKDELKLSQKFHLRYFALHIEDLASAAVRVADQLSVMTIKRSL